MDAKKNFQKSLNFYQQNKIIKLIKKPFKTIIYFLFVKVFPKLKIKFVFGIRGKTFFGDNMKLILPEAVSSSIYYYGFFEEDVARYLLDYLKPGKTFIDIGAHIGYYSLLASYLVGNKGKIHSFEPTSSTFQIFKENIQNKENIFINQKALIDKEGKIDLNDYGLEMMAMNSLSRSSFRIGREEIKSKKISVEVATLDNYCAEKNIKPDFIKIDAEGSEYKIFLGAENIIKKLFPIIVFEIGGEDDKIWAENCRKSIEFLKNLDYKFFVYDKNLSRIKIYKSGDNLYFEHANLLCIKNHG